VETIFFHCLEEAVRRDDERLMRKLLTIDDSAIASATERRNLSCLVLASQLGRTRLLNLLVSSGYTLRHLLVDLSDGSNTEPLNNDFILKQSYYII
jgi:hypothetical protein